MGKTLARDRAAWPRGIGGGRPHGLAPDAMLRVIGLSEVAPGGALELALDETDGIGRLKTIDIERHAMTRAPDAERGVADILLTFMGNRALQPFAVDAIALLATSSISAGRLAGLCHVAVPRPAGLRDVRVCQQRLAGRIGMAEALCVLAVRRLKGLGAMRG